MRDTVAAQEPEEIAPADAALVAKAVGKKLREELPPEPPTPKMQALLDALGGVALDAKRKAK